MKPLFQVNETTLQNSFLVRYIETPHTSKRYHYHEEYELLFNLENSGIRCIGDSIEKYQKNDLVLIGNKVPHFWQSDEVYFSDKPGFKTKAILVQFDKNLFADAIFGFTELAPIKNLFENASQGIQIKGPDACIIGEKLVQLTRLKGWNRLLMLFEILLMMSESRNFRLLSSTGFGGSHCNLNEERISKILNLMVENYNRDVTLEEAACFINMSVSAFCRYFKKHTNKTYSQLLNEIRIGFACRGLMYTENSISEIAFNSGYNNVPYFNRLFKRLKEVTPNEYRQQHMTVPV